MKKIKKYLQLLPIVMMVAITTNCNADELASLPKLTKSDYISTKCYSSLVSQMGGVCKYIKVEAEPENKNNNKYLDVYYSIIPATDKTTPKKEPIIFLIGGPGPGSTLYIQELFAYNGGAHLKLLKHHDYIFVDYRGTGFSRPFPKCGKIDGDHVKGVNKCYKKLPKEVDTSYYSTANFAYDINKILRKENIKKVNLFGISYGVRVATTIMRDYPQIVNKAVLEGVFAIEVNGATQGGEAILDKLAYLRDKYNKAYSKEDFETRLLKYLHKIDKKDRLKRIEGIAYIAYKDNSEVKVKKEFDKNKPSKSFGEYHKPDPFGRVDKYVDKKYKYRAMSDIMTTSIMLSEEFAFTNQQPMHIFGFGKELSSLASKYNAGSPIPLDRINDSIVKAHKPNPIEMKPVVSNIPSLILTGEYDMQTPRFWAVNAQKHLSKSKHFFFMGKDHGFARNTKKVILPKI